MWKMLQLGKFPRKTEVYLGTTPRDLAVGNVGLC